jgi:hypothetical protein
LGTEPELTLRSSPTRQVAAAVFCAVSAAISLAAITRGGAWLGLVVATLSALGILVAVIQALRGGAYLHLTVDGFEVRRAFHRTFIRWADVSDFRVIKSGVRSFVGFDFVRAGGAKRLRGVVRAFTGAEAVLLDGYGYKQQELAGILNSWRAGVRSGSDTGGSRTTG